jgi:hypothetical protein
MISVSIELSDVTASDEVVGFAVLVVDISVSLTDSVSENQQ